MATAAVPEVENPSDINSVPTTTEDTLSTKPPPSSDLGGDETKVTPPAPEDKARDVTDGAAVTDIEKKMKRAERFGVAVKLSEVDKRNSRAERFGTAAGTNAQDSAKQSEELKRKARADRFGIVQPAPANEEGKKKARVDRFGSSPKIDSAEEDKKKARAIRFSKADSGSNAKLEVQAAIVGKAVGEA